MEYRVITAISEYRLRNEVIEMIRQGWQPQGGISYTLHLGGVSETWAQAMVKEETDE